MASTVWARKRGKVSRVPMDALTEVSVRLSSSSAGETELTGGAEEVAEMGKTGEAVERAVGSGMGQEWLEVVERWLVVRWA